MKDTLPTIPQTLEPIHLMIMNKETLNELLKELLQAVVMDDKKMKDLDKSINPNSDSLAIHLTKTIIEYANK